MKRIITFIISIVVVFHLSACSDQKNINPESQISSETENVVKHVSSSDILKITEDMTKKEIMELLGETLNDGWFLYIVDGMQYLDTGGFPKVSGAEILDIM